MSDCIFCKIIAGQIPASTVYEDEDFIAFLDIRPIHAGHVLLVPRFHAQYLHELPHDILMKELPLASRIATALREVCQVTDYNLFVTNGPQSGQEVFHHHLHIIPRSPHDGFELTSVPKPYAEGEGTKLATRIAKRLLMIRGTP